MISITWFGMAFGMGANKKLGVVMGFVTEIVIGGTCTIYICTRARLVSYFEN